MYRSIRYTYQRQLPSTIALLVENWMTRDLTHPAPRMAYASSAPFFARFDEDRGAIMHLNDCPMDAGGDQ